MKNTILDLWYGNTDPQEHKNDDPRIKDLMKLAARNSGELSETLNEKQKGLLEKYSDGLICTTACIASATSQAIINGHRDTAKKLLKRFALKLKRK